MTHPLRTFWLCGVIAISTIAAAQSAGRQTGLRLSPTGGLRTPVFVRAGSTRITSPTVIDRPAVVAVGCTDWWMSAPLVIASDNVTVIGTCGTRSALRRAPGYTGQLITISGQGHSGLTISNLTIDNGDFRSANDDASAQIFLNSSNSDIRILHNSFIRQGAGRAIASAGASVAGTAVWIVRNSFSGIMPSATAASVSRVANVVTVTTTSAHGLASGQQVSISHVSDLTLDAIALTQSVPAPNQFRYAQTGADATGTGGNITVVNTRTISLVTPGNDVHILRNWFNSVGAVTLEPAQEAADTGWEICGNRFDNVDATNILLRAGENSVVDTVRVCDNTFVDAGLTLGKGFIAVGENAGAGVKPAVMRNVVITGNAGRGWGNAAGAKTGPYVGPSVGIGVGGAVHGAQVDNVEVSGNVLYGLTRDGRQPDSGYGIFLRNYVSNFNVHDNTVSYSGRSCVATTYVTGGAVADNRCEYPVTFSAARNPSPAGEGCYQIDLVSRNVSVTGNSCRNPGTPAAGANGFFVQDSVTVDTVVIRGNSVVWDDLVNALMLNGYAIGQKATNITVAR